MTQLQLWLKLLWCASPSNSSKPQHHLQQQSWAVFNRSCRASSQTRKIQLELQNSQRMGIFVNYQIFSCCHMYYHSFILRFSWSYWLHQKNKWRWYKNTSFNTGNVQKNRQAAPKRRFPSGQLMNTDHMVVSRFDVKINTLVCTLRTWTNISGWKVPAFGNWTS